MKERRENKMDNPRKDTLNALANAAEILSPKRSAMVIILGESDVNTEVALRATSTLSLAMLLAGVMTSVEAGVRDRGHDEFADRIKAALVSIFGESITNPELLEMEEG